MFRPIRLTALCLSLPAALVPTAARASAQAPPGTTVTADGTSRLWTTRYPAGFGSSVATSPDGSTVYVAGGPVVAYNAQTGATLWAVQDSSASQLAVSPDGATVFVTGFITQTSGIEEYQTSAYASGTGALLWTATYHGPGAGNDVPRSIAVSPDGSAVFVTGDSSNAAAGAASAYATVAYDATSGTQLWVARYSDGGNADANSVAVDPGGARVYVTGGSDGLAAGGGGTSYACATVAYDAATGSQAWARSPSR